MKLIIFILLFFFCKQSFSQVAFDNDTSYKPFLGLTTKQIDSSFHLVKDNEFEFRFWALYSKTMKKQLFILSLKQNQWSARLFEKIVKGIDTLIEVPVKQTDLINLWKNLNKNNILTISKDYDLHDKMGNEINLAIHDGISFHFELLNHNSKRSYFYHCPKGHSEEYKYIKEYKWVTNMVQLIFTYCGINRNYIC